MCGVFESPSLLTGIPFANTLNDPSILDGAEQCGDSLSPILATGLIVQVFIGGENRSYYNLNLEN